ncbi:Aldose 1-epimerase [Shewanella sp. P1-14-1]|uniref:aldose epimerase family protein n=1 Tax=Shewanella sp. P1-14-1 TaxID=1723761 RepID=UPI0006D65EEB|nr:hypothetical protein [Shewanella sp. P1-14-1]KPZ71564.1 Aldose 1-epimerase [Shewanella sp. P1-14-1]
MLTLTRSFVKALSGRQETNVEVITLANARVSMSIVPELGAKIISLKSLTNQYEWLQQSPYSKMSVPEYGDSFINGFDTGGWDECFPSIKQEIYSAEGYKDLALPDHGELWCLHWKITKIIETDNFVTLSLCCQGRQLPYQFTRSITLHKDSHEFVIHYQLVNLGLNPLPYMWSMHPIFAAQPGMQIQLSDNIKQFYTDNGFNRFFNHSESVIHWPYTYAPSNIDSLIENHTFKAVAQSLNQPFASQSCDNQRYSQYCCLSYVMDKQSHFASKLFSKPMNNNAQNNLITVALTRENGAQRCGFSYYSDEVSHVGLWLNYQGWSGSALAPAYVVGLEPCIGGHDSLQQAMTKNEYAQVPASGKHSWSVSCFIE